MTFWRRAPRSVYQVYDEESYLSGEGAAAGVGEPVGASGPVDAGRPVGDGREHMEALSHGPRAARLLILGLLGVITAVAAIIVAAHVLHHSRAAPSPVAAHRDRTRSAWTAMPQPPTPASRERPRSTTRTVTSAPVASVPALPAPSSHSFAAASSGGSGRSDASAVSPLASPTQPLVGIADAASLPASELPSTDELSSTNASLPEAASPSANELHTDGEFGFEL
jgi:hypothetical protein